MRTSLILLLSSLLFSCEQNETIPQTTKSTVSSSTSTSASNLVTFATAKWHSYVGNAGNQSNPNQYRHTITSSKASTVSSSPISNSGLGGLLSPATSYTLGVSTSTIVDTTSYCSWVYSFFPPASLWVGWSLTLSAKVQLENVRGKGVSLVLRGDRNKQPLVLFATTEGKMPLKGTADFTEYSVTLPYSASVDYLLIYFVLLPNTTGTARFTDISVVISK